MFCFEQTHSLSSPSSLLPVFERAQADLRPAFLGPNSTRLPCRVNLFVYFHFNSRASTCVGVWPGNGRTFRSRDSRTVDAVTSPNARPDSGRMMLYLQLCCNLAVLCRSCFAYSIVPGETHVPADPDSLQACKLRCATADKSCGRSTLCVEILLSRYRKSIMAYIAMASQYSMTHPLVPDVLQ